MEFIAVSVTSKKQIDFLNDYLRSQSIKFGSERELWMSKNINEGWVIVWKLDSGEFIQSMSDITKEEIIRQTKYKNTFIDHQLFFKRFEYLKDFIERPSDEDVISTIRKEIWNL